MKNITYLLIFVIISCDNKSKLNDKPNINDSTKKETKITKSENSEYYTTKDTILITTEIGDTLKFGKVKFNTIIDKHPEFFTEFQSNPDLAYFNGNDRDEFGSEVGQDCYYTLYAYFFKQKNGIKKFEKQRQKLIDIYLNINSLFGHFQYGGTYFGHQSSRILGYAEYSIYLLPESKEEIEKTYDITKQKELYIKSLRQLIKDESTIDNETLGKAKIERTKELNKIVDDLDKLITDNFYLRRAQEFHYGNYQYY